MPPAAREARTTSLGDLDERLGSGVDLDRLREMVERLTGDIDSASRKR